MCGGEVDVWIDPSPVARDPSMWAELVSFLEGDVACVLATRLEPFAQTVRRPGDAVCCSSLDTAVSEAHRERQSALRDVAGEEWFFNVLAPRPRLVIVGAVHIAKALVAMANAVGFETIVIEPRTALTKSERFDVQPDTMIEQWPQDAFKEIALNEDTYAVALTHDPKIDDNALEVLLKSNVAYVGALGSKTTQDKRRKSLSETGLTDEQLDRIHGPVGLEIGAKTPEEIALSIIAQIVKVRRARS
jgi:xanthine dehydrogenase accessory factor